MNEENEKPHTIDAKVEILGATVEVGIKDVVDLLIVSARVGVPGAGYTQTKTTLGYYLPAGEGVAFARKYLGVEAQVKNLE